MVVMWMYAGCMERMVKIMSPVTMRGGFVNYSDRGHFKLKLLSTSRVASYAKQSYLYYLAKRDRGGDDGSFSNIID